MIHCNATGLVFSNPRPHLKAVHAWHPSVVQLRDGALLCAFDLGQAPESLDYRTYIARLETDGVTWSQPRPILNDGFPGLTTHTVRISQLGDGALVGLGARFHRQNPEEGIANRNTMGLVVMDLIMTSSLDGGHTWQGPTTIVPPLEGPAFEVCHAIIELANGDWWAPTQTWPDWDGRAPNGMKAVALVSHDQGGSWPDYVQVFDSNNGATIHFEQSVTQMADGRLLAVAWAYDRATRKTLPTPYTISENGRSFAAPRIGGINGQTAKLLSLDGDHFLCAYRRQDKPGLWIQLARLAGREWINIEELLLWEGSSAGKKRSVNTSDELSSLKFGYPSLCRLPNDEIMVVFWCEEDGLHNIRWYRLSVPIESQQIPLAAPLVDVERVTSR
jgi:hypothetical protein